MSQDVNHMEAAPEPSSFRLIATLGLAGFISGLILVSVYLYTKPIIENNKAEALKAAIFEVLPNTESFRVIILDGDALHLQAEGEEDAEWMIYEGLDANGITTGFAIPGAEAGYQDIISALFGYDAISQNIIGFKVLDSKETPGLGDKIYKDDAFQLNFQSLGTTPDVQIVKKGEKNADNQVEAITGATISSNAIGRLINASLIKWKQPIAEYSNNPKNESHD